MYPGVNQLTNGSSSANSKQKVQSDSVIGPGLHLAVKFPEAIEPIIFNVCDIIKIFFFLVIHLCVITKITLRPHFVIVGKVIKSIW